MPNRSAEMFDFVLIALQHTVHDIWAPSHRPIQRSQGPTGWPCIPYRLSGSIHGWWQKVWSCQGLALTLCCQGWRVEDLAESRCEDTIATVLFLFFFFLVNPTRFPGISWWSILAREARYMCHKCSSWYRKSVKHWHWTSLYRWWNLPLSLHSQQSISTPHHFTTKLKDTPWFDHIY
jgi:hypothetical protein